MLVDGTTYGYASYLYDYANQSLHEPLYEYCTSLDLFSFTVCTGHGRLEPCRVCEHGEGDANTVVRRSSLSSVQFHALKTMFSESIILP